MARMKPVCLIVMDGWGVAPADEKNALAKAEQRPFPIPPLYKVLLCLLKLLFHIYLPNLS